MEVIRQLTLINREGLHARPAVKLVDTANRFRAEIVIKTEGREISVKSMMSVLTLGAATGTVLNFIARGDDAEEAIAAIEALIAGRFDED
jgi:phosphotransferase system HPr (HPr) family protein